MSSPDIWNDREKAQQAITRLKTLKEIVSPMQTIQQALEDLAVMAELADEEGGVDGEAEYSRERARLLESLEKFELDAMLSGEDDGRDAYMHIHAGAGGTESCDWVRMLLRMYTHWAESRGFKLETVDMLPGEEAGIKRVIIHVNGSRAFGYLKSERGVHRLVRISPFDSNARRHTTFAAVDVTPVVDDDPDIVIADNDIEMEFLRSRGPGGQHVNKTSSAVRLKHIPSGIVVHCQDQRSQHKNRQMALSLLKAKLREMEALKRKDKQDASYDEMGEIAWGYQIRSYVLQPYQMVKDLRTSYETGNAQGVLDGNLDPFIGSYLRMQMTEQSKTN